MPGEKKGFLGSLRDLVLEDEGKGESPPTPTPSAPIFSTASAQGIPTSTPSFSLPSQVTVSTEIDQEMLAEVEAALAGASPAAYIQFADIVASFSVLPDEKSRFTAALVTAKRTLNLTAQSIQAAYEQRINMVGSLKASFVEQSNASLSEKVKGAESRVAQADRDISSIQGEIDRLTARLNELKRVRANESEEIENARAHVEGVRSKMQVVFDVVLAKAKTERDIVSRNITGA